MNVHDLATKPQLVSRDGTCKAEQAPPLTVSEMAALFHAYDAETRKFIFDEWLDMDWPARDARQAEIDARHGYKHGWITANGVSFDRHQAFPDDLFLNVWD